MELTGTVTFSQDLSPTLQINFTVSAMAMQDLVNPTRVNPQYNVNIMLLIHKIVCSAHNNVHACNGITRQ